MSDNVKSYCSVFVAIVKRWSIYPVCILSFCCIPPGFLLLSIRCSHQFLVPEQCSDRPWRRQERNSLPSPTIGQFTLFTTNNNYHWVSMFAHVTFAFDRSDGTSNSPTWSLIGLSSIRGEFQPTGEAGNKLLVDFPALSMGNIFMAKKITYIYVLVSLVKRGRFLLNTRCLLFSKHLTNYCTGHEEILINPFEND